MSKLILLIAVISLCGSLFYFFIQRDLFLGSILLVATIGFNIVYATFYNVNIIKKG